MPRVPRFAALPYAQGPLLAVCHWIASPSTLANPQNLHLAAADRDHITHRLAEQRARQRRHMRERTMRGVGLVLADDAEGLPAAVVAFDGDGCAELHAAQIGRRRDQLGA